MTALYKMNEKLNKVKELLGVRCLFPSSFDITDEIAIRCMLESSTNSKVLKFKDTTEDVVVRLKPNSKKNDRAEEIKYMLSKLFSSIEIQSCIDGGSSCSNMVVLKRKPTTALHPNIANVIKCVESPTDFLIVQVFAKHSILSISRFHAATTLSSATLGNISGLGSRDLRLRFIIYQLLQAVAFVHKQGLCVDSLIPANIMLDDDMWVYLPVGTSDKTCDVAAMHINNSNTNTIIDKNMTVNATACSSSYISRPIDYYEPLTLQWVLGKLSNYDYLMSINYAAGRTMMDPLYHPIMPWVTDFSTYPVYDPSTTMMTHDDSGYSYYGGGGSSSSGGLRDLTKTKFRLSKGDAQLETTYKHSEPSHHVPESLSELTYYIYLARRTPLQVLRRVVRDIFVPEHYPHSMSRIFDWTPDECIPEFYSDPSVLVSIHKEDYGLQDIELPGFASTPSEFIAFHRAVLESEEVSRKLHRWIDLTFGYCLFGEAAVSNMNVPLRHTRSSSSDSSAAGLVDAPDDVNKNPGFVMLFDCPHPRRNSRNIIYNGNTIKDNDTKIQCDTNIISNTSLLLQQQQIEEKEVRNSIALSSSTSVTACNSSHIYSYNNEIDKTVLTTTPIISSATVYYSNHLSLNDTTIQGCLGLDALLALDNHLKSESFVNNNNYHHTNHHQQLSSNNHRAVSSSGNNTVAVSPLIGNQRNASNNNNNTSSISRHDIASTATITSHPSATQFLPSLQSVDTNTGSSSNVNNNYYNSVNLASSNPANTGTTTTIASMFLSDETARMVGASNNSSSSSGTSNNINNTTTSSSSSSLRKTATGQQRKSLLRPAVIDSSLNVLRNAAPINSSNNVVDTEYNNNNRDCGNNSHRNTNKIVMSSNNGYKTATAAATSIAEHLHTQVQQYQFSACFNTALDAVYSLPLTTITSEFASSDSAAAASIEKPSLMSAKGVSWDIEFHSRMQETSRLCSLKYGAKKNEKLVSDDSNSSIVMNNNLEKQKMMDDEKESRSRRFIQQAQADDMFAVGCVIAELYNGRPLINNNDAMAMILDKSNGYLETMKHVYRNTAAAAANTSGTGELPLVARRLITMLLQPDAMVRPTAAEVLQACVRGDANTWNNRDYSLQRTGGYTPGYVDFQKYTVSSSTVVTVVATLHRQQQQLQSREYSPERQQSSKHSSSSSSSSSRPSVNSKSASNSSSSSSSSKQQLSGSSSSLSSSSNGRILREFVDVEMNNEIYNMHRGPRVDLLSEFCSGLFPAYFHTVYRLIGELKMCKDDGLAKFQVLLYRLDDLLSIPLEGINLALRHLLYIISESAPFCKTNNNDGDGSNESVSGQYESKDAHKSLNNNNNINASSAPSHEVKKAILVEYHRIIDVLGLRLGIEGTENLIVPKVVEFLNNLTSVDMVEGLLRSSLWNVLLLRSGVRCFLKHFLPVLLTYLSAGTLHHVSSATGICGVGDRVNREKKTCNSNSNNSSSSVGNRSRINTASSLDDIDNISKHRCNGHHRGNHYQCSAIINGNACSNNYSTEVAVAPLWAKGEYLENGSAAEWLHSFPLYEVREVEQAAMTAIVSLMEPDAMGLGLCTRYILPALLSLLGVPQLAGAGYDQKMSLEVSNTENPAAILTEDEANSLFDRLITTISSKKKLKSAMQKQHTTTTTTTEVPSAVASPIASKEHEQQHVLITDEALKESISKEEMVQLEQVIAQESCYESQDRCVARTVINLCMQLGDLVVSELVLSKIFNGTLPELINSLLLHSTTATVTSLSSNTTTSISSAAVSPSSVAVVPPPPLSPSVIAALMEVVQLLNGILPSLHPETVQKDYLQPAKVSGMCLPKLLALLPFTPSWQLVDAFLMDDYSTNSTSLDNKNNGNSSTSANNIKSNNIVIYSDLNSYINAQRRHNLHYELCRLIVSSSMIAGAEVCQEFVLPSVDIFFRNFVTAFGNLPIESKTMMKGFEMGSELFMPLAQLTGPEAFYTSVPNINPRLEMWLVSVGSNIPARSPPLPGNIWPEVVSEVENQPLKKKGFIQWISGAASRTSSSAASKLTNIIPLSLTSSISYSGTNSSSSSSSLSNSNNNCSTVDSNSVVAATVAIENVSLSCESNHTLSAAAAVISDSSVPVAISSSNRTAQSYSASIRKMKKQERDDGSCDSTTGSVCDGINNASASGTESCQLKQQQQHGSHLFGEDTLSHSGSDSSDLYDYHTASSSFDLHQQQLQHSTNRRSDQSNDSLEISSPSMNAAAARILRSSSSDDADISRSSSSAVASIVPDRHNTAMTTVSDRHNTGMTTVSDREQLILPAQPSMLITLDEDDDDNSTVGTAAVVVENDIGAAVVVMDDSIVIAGTTTAVDTMDCSFDAISSPSISSSSTITAIVIGPSVNSPAAGATASPAVSKSDDVSYNIDSNSSCCGTIKPQYSHAQPFKSYQRLMTYRRVAKNSLRNSLLGSLTVSKANSKASRKLKVGNLFTSSDIDTADEIENKELYYNEAAWLLAGNGRWNVEQDLKDKSAREQWRLYKSTSSSNNNNKNYNNSSNNHDSSTMNGSAAVVVSDINPSYQTTSGIGCDWNPAAYLSLTAPRIATDAAADAGALFQLNMQANSQWKLEDHMPPQHPGSIKCMAVNSNESLLLTCSRSGVRLWSLTSHPLLHVSSYSHHNAPPFSAGFLRGGIHAATCDGNIHIWDIESRQTMAYLNASSTGLSSFSSYDNLASSSLHTSSSGKNNNSMTSAAAAGAGTASSSYNSLGGFTSMSLVSSRQGITSSSIESYGDDQLITTLGNTLSYYDIRMRCTRAVRPVAEWMLPQLPPLSGTFITGSLEPLQLTCAAASRDHYLFAGSAGGGLWVVDKRMGGKILASWQAVQDGSLIKLSALSDKHVLAISDRSASVWEYNATVAAAAAADEPTGYYSSTNTSLTSALPNHHLHAYVTRSASHCDITSNSSSSNYFSAINDNYSTATTSSVVTDYSKYDDGGYAAAMNELHRQNNNNNNNTRFHSNSSSSGSNHHGGRSGGSSHYYNNNNNGSNSSAPSVYRGGGDSNNGPTSSSSSSSLLHMGLGVSQGVGGEVKKVLNIRNMPDNVTAACTLMVSCMEPPRNGSSSSGSSSNNNNNNGGGSNSEKGYNSGSSNDNSSFSSSKQQQQPYVLYCMSGHKMFTGKLPCYDKSNRDVAAMNVIGSNNFSAEFSNDNEEIRMNPHYFLDRKGTKITKSKLQITSSVLLPLRRLLLVGTDDGLIRIVS